MKPGIIAAATVVIIGISARASAAPYQLEAALNFGSSEVKVPATFFGESFESESDVKGLDLALYFPTVESDTGPLRETAFVGKSSVIRGAYQVTEPDGGDDVSLTSVAGRFVTQDDTIFELIYNQQDAGDNDETGIFGVGVGKYIDDSSTALISFQRTDDDFEINTFAVVYRTLKVNEPSGTSTALDFGFGIIDAESESGYLFNFGLTYYPRNNVTLNASVLRSSIDDFNNDTFALNGEYFFTNTLFTGVSLARNRLGEFADVDVILAKIGARF